VTGLAKDPSGGSVPNASVTLTNQDTGVRRAASTNTSGAYSFPDLAPGVYKLEASAKGFRSLSTRGFPVEAYGTVRQDLNFEIAADATEVLVTEAAPRPSRWKRRRWGRTCWRGRSSKPHQPAQHLEKFGRFGTHFGDHAADRAGRGAGGKRRQVADAGRGRKPASK